jgi:hypothetical protein
MRNFRQGAQFREIDLVLHSLRQICSTFALGHCVQRAAILSKPETDHGE